MAEPEVVNPFEDKDSILSKPTAVPSPIVSTIDADALADIDKKIKEAQDNNSFKFLFETAVKEEWSINSISQLSNRAHASIYAPVTEMTPEKVKFLTEGLEDTAAIEEVVQKALDRSEEDALLLRQDYLKTQENRQTLGGDGGTLATVMAATLDVPELLAIGATTTLFPPLGAGMALKKGYNLRRAFKVGGTVGAVESGIFETIRSASKYDVSGGDVAFALSAGGLFGGTLNTMTTAFARKHRFHQVLKKESEGKPLSIDEIDFLEDIDGARAISAALERAEASRAFDEVVDLDSARMFNDEGVAVDTDGATLPDQDINVATVTPEIAAETPFQRGSFSAVRKHFAASALGLNSPNSMTRWAFSKMGLNSVGNKPDPVTGKITPVETPATQYKMMHESRFVLSFEQVHKPA